MGIYTSGTIFGIKIYIYNDHDLANTLFEEKYLEIMSHEQMREVYLFYTELINKQKIQENELRFQYYTECTSTICQANYFNWFPMTLQLFLEKFGI